ncbi:MAG: HAD family hydrolase [bacterium]
MQKIIIFDLDGVLLDSEEFYMDMNQKFFKELGADISLEEHQTFVGISATKMWAYIKEKANLSQTVEELKALERELKHKTLLETKLVSSNGVVEFLKRLKASQYTLAIASSEFRKNIELILNKLGVTEFFDLIVSGEDVANGKPAPDIFLKVSSHYGREPGDCVVIEDSTNGVMAAKSASMTCLAYFNPTSGKQDLSRADLVFDHFDDKKLHQRMGL